MEGQGKRQMVELVGMVVCRSWRWQVCAQSALQAVQQLVLVERVLAMAAECWWRGWLTQRLDVLGEAQQCLCCQRVLHNLHCNVGYFSVHA
jgi:hypothetical protein